MAVPKRTFRSLICPLLIPLCLTITTILLFGSGHKYRVLVQTKSWVPPLRLIHLASLGSSFLMGLSAWIVWADGGFHGPSDDELLPLYIAQVSLSLVWDPLVLRIGAAYLGLVFCFLYFGTSVGCYKKFREVNPVAGVFVMPCLAWVAFLTYVNFKLVFL